MTKRRFFKDISILLISLVLGGVSLLSSCNNIEENSSSETPAVPAGIILVTASVAPENKAARFAAPDALDDATNFDYSATLTVTGGSPSSLVSGTYDTSTKKVTFSFDAPSATSGITIDIYAHLKGTSTPTSSNAVLHASKPNLSISDGKIAVGTMTLSKHTGNTANGTASLSITLPSSDYTLTASCATGTFTVEGTSPNVTVKGNDLSAGAYTIVFTVKKGEEIVYIWKEVINIYAGMETNSWKSIADNGTVSTSDKKTIEDATIQAAALTTFFVRGSDATWYGTNLSTATSDDSNPGTVSRPLATVQKAIDKVKAANDGVTKYTIYVDGEFTADWSEKATPLANIAAGSDSLKLSIIGLGSDSQKTTFNGDNKIYNVVKGSGTNLVLNLENLKITGGDGQSNSAWQKGGGVLAQDGVYTLINCEITGNKARSGGGVALLGKSLTLSGCVVNKNHSNFGGGISIYSYGSSGDTDEANPVLLTLKDNTIVGNKNLSSLPTNSDDYGNTTDGHSAGILAATDNYTDRKPAKIIIESGCYIIGNHSAGKAGGILLENTGTLVINDGAFVEYNYASNGDGGGILIAHGTGYTAPSATISGSIIGNKASTNGGGIATTGGTLTLNGAEFYDNYASDGGAVYNSGTVTISEGTRIGEEDKENWASDSGGGIYNSGTITMTGGIIDNNYAGNSGGGIYNENGSISFSGESTINSNASSEGGGLYNDSGEISIIGKLHITKNISTNGNGGGIYTTATIIIPNDVEINENKALSENLSIYGGAIYSTANLTIQGGTFYKNAALYTGSDTTKFSAGGAISVDGELSITGGTFEENSANRGGAIYVKGITSISDGIIQSNSAGIGGGIYTANTLNISGSAKILENIAVNGGGIFADLIVTDEVNNTYIVGTPNITGGTIQGNECTSFGKGICMNAFTELRLSENAKIEDEIYLFYYEGYANFSAKIKITGSLNKTAPIATITPGKYDASYKVLEAETGVTLATEAAKFKVTDDSSGKSWKVNADGKLAEDVSTTNLTVEEVASGYGLSSMTGNVIITGAATASNWVGLTNEISVCTNTDLNITLIMTDDSTIEEIGMYDATTTVFNSSVCLVAITIPSSVKKISAGQFTTCERLSSVTFSNTSGWYYTTAGIKQTIDVSEPKQNATKLKAGGDWNEKELKYSNFSTAEIDDAGDSDTISPSVTLETLNDLEILKNSVLAATTRGANVNLTLTATVKSQAELETLANYIDNAVMTSASNLSKLFIDLIITDDSTIEKIGENTPPAGTSAKGVFDQRTHLKSIKLPEGLKEITDAAFNMCENLETVILPTSMKTVGTEAFLSCTALSSINLPEGISTIGERAFDGCANLKNVTLPSTLTSIGDSAFSSTGLTSISIPENVKYIGCSAFVDCEGLASVSFEKTSDWHYSDGSTVIKIDSLSDTTSNAEKLKDDTAGNWGSGYIYNKLDGEKAGELLENMTTGNVSLVVEASDDNDLKKLATSLGKTGAVVDLVLSIPEGGSLTIGNSVFANCTKLRSIVIPEGVEYIGSGTFQSCENLESITIPSSVKEIYVNVFYGCKNLSSAIFSSPDGWYYKDSQYVTGKTAFLESDLSTPATAATYLKSTYLSKFWTKN